MEGRRESPMFLCLLVCLLTYGTSLCAMATQKTDGVTDSGNSIQIFEDYMEVDTSLEKTLHTLDMPSELKQWEKYNVPGGPMTEEQQKALINYMGDLLSPSERAQYKALEKEKRKVAKQAGEGTDDSDSVEYLSAEEEDDDHSSLDPPLSSLEWAGLPDMSLVYKPPQPSTSPFPTGPPSEPSGSSLTPAKPWELKRNMSFKSLVLIKRSLWMLDKLQAFLKGATYVHPRQKDLIDILLRYMSILQYAELSQLNLSYDSLRMIYAKLDVLVHIEGLPLG